jgi:hypothetical protein
MERCVPSDCGTVEFVSHVRKDDLIAPHDGGGPSSDGASELCGALDGKLEQAQACEVGMP